MRGRPAIAAVSASKSNTLRTEEQKENFGMDDEDNVVVAVEGVGVIGTGILLLRDGVGFVCEFECVDVIWDDMTCDGAARLWREDKILRRWERASRAIRPDMT